MTKQSFTPGPWSRYGTRAIVANDGRKIAHITGDPTDDIESEYDARLIVAAPELLNICKEAVQTLEATFTVFALHQMEGTLI